MDARDPLPTIAGPVRAETEAKASRFLAVLMPVADDEGATEAVAAVRRELPDARHHCSARVLGPDGALVRSDDDGEPGGTAGAPMLSALQGSGLTDVVAVVSRYFGGTLLGAGGLVRAYGGAVSAALDVAVRQPRIRVTEVALHGDHADAGRVEHLLRGWLAGVGGAVQGVSYDADGVHWQLVLPSDQLSALGAVLIAAGVPGTPEVLGSAVRAITR